MDGTQITPGPGVQRLHFQWKTRNLSSLLPEPLANSSERGIVENLIKCAVDVLMFMWGGEYTALALTLHKKYRGGNLKSTKHWGLFWIISLVRLWYYSFPLVGEVTFSARMQMHFAVILFILVIECTAGGKHLRTQLPQLRWTADQWMKNNAVSPKQRN